MEKQNNISKMTLHEKSENAVRRNYFEREVIKKWKK